MAMKKYKDEYINFSGGAFGSDMTWDKLGRRHGFNNHIHFTPNDYHEASRDVKNQIDLAVTLAADGLGRPQYFSGMDLVRRNWFQVAPVEAVFAISRIIAPGDYDVQFKNKTGKQVVSGGTGWAVEMAINMQKRIYVFDQNVNKWFEWVDCEYRFIGLCDYKGKPLTIPTLTTRYAGIGTRQLTIHGTDAIRQCYEHLYALTK